MAEYGLALFAFFSIGLCVGAWLIERHYNRPSELFDQDKMR